MSAVLLFDLFSTERCNMKRKLIWAMGLVLVLSTVAVAESPARPTNEVPDATLAAMGLADMSRIDDAEGQTVRGSFAIAASFSWASGIITVTTPPVISISNPALATSAAIGVGPGVRFSTGYAFAAGF